MFADGIACSVRRCHRHYSCAVTISGLVWRDGKRVDVSIDAETLRGLVVDPSYLVWVDLCGVDDATLTRIGEVLKLDAHSLEDATTPGERPKATRFDGYSFATIYGATFSPTRDQRLQLARVSAYTLPECLLTVRRDESFDMGPVVERWTSDAKLVAFGVDGLLQGLLDVAIDQQFDVLQGLDEEAEGLIDDLFGDNPNLQGLQKRTFTIRREMVGLRRVVPPMRDVIATLIRAGEADRRWSTELLSYYEDLSDHVLRATEWLDGLRDLVSSIFETNLALNDNRMNQVMKKLACWAAIIAVPTLISGIFGMNVAYWGFGTTAGFVVSLVLIVGSAVTLWLVMRHQDWI